MRYAQGMDGRGRSAWSGCDDAVGLGRQFGLLTVVREAAPYWWRGRISHRCWVCDCACGRQTSVRQDVLLSGHTRSCGCEKRRCAVACHGRHMARAAGRRSPEYDAWRRLRQAARDGQVVPSSWQSRDGFPVFLAAVGSRPAPGLRLCCVAGRDARLAEHWHWAKPAAAPGMAHWLLRYGGQTMTFRDLARATGTRYATLLKRFERGRPILHGADEELEGPFPAAA